MKILIATFFSFITVSSFASHKFTKVDTQFLYSLSENQAIQLAEANVWKKAISDCISDTNYYSYRLALRESESKISKNNNSITVKIDFTCY